MLPIIALARGIDAVLRNSSFRSGYELLFVPMGAAERRRIKTFLDVTCDRAGEALGALLVYVLLFTSTKFLTNELLGLVIAMPSASSSQMREAIGRRKLEDEYNRFLREMRGEAFVEIRDGSAAAAPAAEPARRPRNGRLAGSAAGETVSD